MHDRDAAEISARAEQGGMAKRQQAKIAVNQIETERIQPVDQNVDGQRRERHDKREHQHHDAGDTRTMSGRELKPAHRRRFR